MCVCTCLLDELALVQIDDDGFFHVHLVKVFDGGRVDADDERERGTHKLLEMTWEDWDEDVLEWDEMGVSG